jgi:hypothetical protein
MLEVVVVWEAGDDCGVRCWRWWSYEMLEVVVV